MGTRRKREELEESGVFVFVKERVCACITVITAMLRKGGACPSKV
jgi:hypothetical protein